MNLYIPMEVKVRELEGRTLLALMAAERGHQVVLGRQGEILRLARRGILPPGLVHQKSIQPGQEKTRMRSLRDNGHTITSQDEESGLLDDSYEPFARKRYTMEGLDLVAKVFCWGQYDCRALQKVFPQYRTKMISTGSPRVDFWRPEFSTYFNLKEDTSMSGARPYLLMASNFGLVHNRLDQEKLLAITLKSPFPGASGEWSEEKFFAGLEYQKRLRDLFVEFLIKLAREVPDIDIVIRPHPVERIPEWESRVAGKANNIHVIREGGITQWILGAEAVIHNGCTSALESVVVGKPVYAYRPIRSEYDREIPNRISMEFSSDEELIAAIRRQVIKNDGNASPAQNGVPPLPELLKDRLDSLEGPLAAERMVAEMEACALPESAPLDPVSLGKRIRLPMAVYNARRAIRKIKKYYLTLGKGRSKPYLAKESAFPDISAGEIRDIRDRLRETLDRFHDIEVIKLHDLVFYIRKKSGAGRGGREV